MTYTIVNPATAPNLAAGEMQVTLDTGQTVAVIASSTRISGGSVTVLVHARQIDPATGGTLADANGHEVTSSASHTFDAATITAQTLPACTKDMTLLALGEPPVLFGAALPPLDPSVAASYSIRNTITAAAHAGPVTDLASVL